MWSGVAQSFSLGFEVEKPDFAGAVAQGCVASCKPGWALPLLRLVTSQRGV